MKYSFKCTCGHVMSVDAGSREEAVEKLKAMMTTDEIAKHMAEAHSGEQVPTKEQVDQQIEAGVMEGDMGNQGGAATGGDMPTSAPTTE